jgi:hypothetical protein
VKGVSFASGGGSDGSCDGSRGGSGDGNGGVMNFSRSGSPAGGRPSNIFLGARGARLTG